MRTVIVIPARYGSSRLPGKPLADIAGKPMIQHVYERAMCVPNVEKVVVATDDQRVVDVVNSFGGFALMTSAHHPSGTDRLVEIMAKVPGDLYVNLQGDEPLIRPSDIELLIQGTAHDNSVQVGTLCHEICLDEAQSSSTVKVVVRGNGDALYFSRSLIPFPRQAADAKYLKHIGIYAYRKEVLQNYGKLIPPMLEKSEMLEQLRLMHAGIRIRTFTVAPTGPGVDTPECLQRVRAIMSGQDYSPSTEGTLADIRLVITDVDGVLTDGGLIYDENGESQKRFHVRDGLGIRMLEECGIRVAVVSGRDSAVLRKRVSDLGIGLHAYGVKDKAAACKAMMLKLGVTSNQTACIGDDSIDLPAFSVCGWPCAVSDAEVYVRKAARICLTRRGGDGAFRELADAILQAQGKVEIFSSAHGYSHVMNRMTQ